MQNSLLIGGFGGQGILLIGKLLCYSADSINMKATFFPSYGGEQRGGTANCTVILSDDEIASPVINVADTVLVMNQPSYDKFINRVKPAGCIIVNSSQVKNIVPRDDIKIVKIEADNIAINLNNIKSANMVMLGAYLKVTNLLSTEIVEKTIGSVLSSKPQFLDTNIRAFHLGYSNTEI